jgi:integrase
VAQETQWYYIKIRKREREREREKCIIMVWFYIETHKKKKSSIFTREQIFAFSNSDTDLAILIIKLVILFCYFGALCMSKYAAILRADVFETDKGLLISIIRKKTDKASVETIFVVPNMLEERCNSIDLYKEYKHLTAAFENNRFFLTYHQKWKSFKNSPIGKNTMAIFLGLVARYLDLPDLATYTGHSLRASSATVLANSDISLENLKRHGGWKSTTIAEKYVRESIHHKTEMTNSFSNTLFLLFSNTSALSVLFVNCVFTDSPITTHVEKK